MDKQKTVTLPLAWKGNDLLLASRPIGNVYSYKSRGENRVWVANATAFIRDYNRMTSYHPSREAAMAALEDAVMTLGVKP